MQNILRYPRPLLKINLACLRFIILLLLLFTNEISRAGTIKPLGGYIYSQGIGNYKYQITANILFAKGSSIPDSVYFKTRWSRFIQISSIQTLCDSTTIANYTWEHSVKDGSTIRIFIDSNFSLVGDSDNLFYFYLIQDIPSTFSSYEISPTFYCGIIHHNPQEVLRGNLFVETKSKDTLSFNNFGAAKYTLTENTNYDSLITLNSSTGDFLYNQKKSLDLHTTTLFSKYFQLLGETRVATTIVTDSSLHSRFIFDKTLINAKDFIEYKKDPGDTLKIDFVFFDPDANSVEVEEFSTLSRFGGELSKLSYSTVNDSTYISLEQYMDLVKCRHLPGSFIFHIKSLQKDGRCITRMLSFIVSNKSYTAVKDEVVYKYVNCYPNPVLDFLQIDLNKPFNYEIYDLTGKMILNGNAEVEIDFRSITEGFYFLKIRNDSQDYKTHKVIKK